MAKYLWEVTYSAEGAKGVLKEGGTGRIEMVEKMLADLGGTLEAAYFSFGDVDVYAIVDVPDNVTAAAISLTVGAGGAAHIKTRVLLTPDEIDRAAGHKVAYRRPGRP